MKKIIGLILSVILCVVSLTGCGEDKPQDYISKENVEVMKQMVEVVDKYLDSDLDADHAKEKLNRLESRLKDGANSEEKIKVIQAKSFSTYTSLKPTKEMQAEADKKLLQERNKVAMPLGMDKKY